MGGLESAAGCCTVLARKGDVAVGEEVSDSYCAPWCTVGRVVS